MGRSKNQPTAALDQERLAWGHTLDRISGELDPYDTARVLRERLQPHDDDASRGMAPLLDLLLARQRFGTALFLLEASDDPSMLEVVARSMPPLPTGLPEESEAHLADLVRLLAAAGGRRALAIVRRYLLEREMTSCWSSVVWALWPLRRALFVRAWLRWLERHDPTAESHAAVVESFLAVPAAIRRIQRALDDTDRDGARRFGAALAARAAHARWLSDSDRAAVRRAVS